MLAGSRRVGIGSRVRECSRFFYFRICSKWNIGGRGGSAVQEEIDEGAMDVQTAVVLDEAQLPELVHETTDPRARAADHFRQRFLTYPGKDRLGFSFLSEMGQQ